MEKGREIYKWYLTLLLMLLINTTTMLPIQVHVPWDTQYVKLKSNFYLGLEF